MKKLIILLCLVIIFILPFSCTGCNEDYLGTVFEYRINVVQGGSYSTSLGPNSSVYGVTSSTSPEHASMFQFAAVQGSNFSMFYRADTEYLGSDFIQYVFNQIENPQELNEYIYRYYITVIADTSGS